MCKCGAKEEYQISELKTSDGLAGVLREETGGSIFTVYTQQVFLQTYAGSIC